MSIAAGARKHIEVTTILLVLAITSVVFRFIAHRRARITPGLDDWTLLVALALVCTLYVEGLVCESQPMPSIDPTLS